MSATPDEIRRLAFSKYLLSLASRHVAQPEPLSSVGLLLLHDAVEHLLVLCCYKVGADPKNSSFLGYWELIEKSGKPTSLPEKGRMAAFNEARVSLKHRGTQPARAQVEEFQRLALGFFESVVPLVFGLGFASVNLTSFVANEDARKSLEDATDAVNAGRFDEAVIAAAYAFDDIENASPLRGHFGIQKMPPPPHVYIEGRGSDEKVREYFNTINEHINWLNRSVDLLSLGVDLSRFMRFQAITPEIVRYLRGPRKHFDRRGPDAPPRTGQDAEFCITFVIDSAFRFQEHPEIPK